jgi:release factor glutamine methyltransferase
MSLRIGVNTVDAVLDQYQRDLSALYPMGEVRAITCAVFHAKLGWDSAELSLRRGSALSESEILSVYLPLKRLRTGEPLQYVLGAVDFHGVPLSVDARVLIPRPETEELVDLIIRSRDNAPHDILDIGTGSGCIALALKKRFPLAEVIGIDASAAALALASQNSAANGLDVSWSLADVLDPAWEIPLADLVVSNPPYVPLSEEATLAVNVRDHEPRMALFVDDVDPLLFYRVIGQQAFRMLPSGGELWFEGHHVHTPEVGRMLERIGFRSVEVLLDLSGASRFTRAIR